MLHFLEIGLSLLALVRVSAYPCQEIALAPREQRTAGILRVVAELVVERD